jgi:spore germination protein GerM
VNQQNRRCPIAVTLIAAITALSLTACGVSTQSTPTVINRGDVPYGLLRQSPRNRPSAKAAGYQYVIFLVAADGLVPVTRTRSHPPAIIDPLRSLILGPTHDEMAFRIHSLLPPGTTLRSVRLDDTTTTVDLGGSFYTATGNSRIIAVAQIVYTATQEPGLTQVRLMFEGRSIEVPRGDATLTDQPLRRADYPPAALATLTTTPPSS